MSVRSMTGFARKSASAAGRELSFAIKSVNHRGLDLQLHVPNEYDALANNLRARIRAQVARGHLNASLNANKTRGGGSFLVDRALVDSYRTEFERLQAEWGAHGPPDLNAALSLPGAFREADLAEPDETLAHAVLDLADQALTEFNQFREREGAELATEIRQRNEAIQHHLDLMQSLRSHAQPAFETRLRAKLEEMLAAAQIDPQRLVQEAALLADRSDITEELTRLRVHARELSEVLDRGGEVGRKLDFLLQEMNREINTVLSKSGGIGEFGLPITNEGLAVKTEIDKMREQVLNLE